MTEKMKDQRSSGKERARPVTNNPDVVRVLERIISPRNGTLKKALQEVRLLGLKAGKESLRKISLRLGFGWQKA